MIQSIRTAALAAALLLPPAVMAQTSEENTDTATITQKINASGVIHVSHPRELEMRLRPAAISADEASETSETPVERKEGRVKKTGGYRVQIFSDNNPRSAKNEARSKERAIKGAFPNYTTYVLYDVPYWRLRVGDFKTHAEAEAAAAEIKNAFPSYRSEITVVRDRVNLTY